jgi:hypothetical protein
MTLPWHPVQDMEATVFNTYGMEAHVQSERTLAQLVRLGGRCQRNLDSSRCFIIAVEHSSTADLESPPFSRVWGLLQSPLKTATASVRGATRSSNSPSKEFQLLGTWKHHLQVPFAQSTALRANRNELSTSETNPFAQQLSDHKSNGERPALYLTSRQIAKMPEAAPAAPAARREEQGVCRNAFRRAVSC